MAKFIVWSDLNPKEQVQALARPAHKDDAAIIASVTGIVKQVKDRGDAALREFSFKFDGAKLKNIRIKPQDIKAAAKSIDPKLMAAMKRAKANIAAFHKAELPGDVQTETMPGVNCALLWRPIETVGLYIPGGTAPLFSTLLMEAIPARIAGCKRVILCTPPQRDGKVHPAILAAAHLCGVTEIYAVGGAQAIAAMAFGTETIPKVDKIFGPGNAYVTTAKQLVAQDPNGAAIDMPAGPSEVLVIADKSSRVDWVAADLLAQAEHDANAQVVFVTPDEDFAASVKRAVQSQLKKLPRRAIAGKSLKHARMIVVANMKEAIEVSNRYAPEHLIMHQHDAEHWLLKITNAGSVFVGPWTPESAGDYASGTNHVLPTYGYARSIGGLTIFSFLKSMSVQAISREGLKKLGPIVVTMAEAEGLHAHANAVFVRLRSV